MFTPDGDIEKIAKLIKNTVKDILGFGFKPERTFVFLNTEYIGEFYHNICHIQKYVA